MSAGIDPLRLPAPAKLNLMLRIVGRRDDGYHLLQSVFQFLTFCDWITLRRRPGSRIRLTRPLPGVAPDSDLTVRAARALQEAVGVACGVDIEIDKQLPMGGGLGGGSSDAATTLIGLNKLWGTGLTVDELAALGLKLGADVPVFVRGHSAWAEGVGEILTPVDLPEPWYVVLMPGCQVATGQVFSAPDLTRDSRSITIADFFAGEQGNDCCPVVTGLYPEIGEALRSLSRFAPARLTGTGACVFAAFSGELEAHKAAEVLGRDWTVFVTQGVNRSPLHRALGLPESG